MTSSSPQKKWKVELNGFQVGGLPGFCWRPMKYGCQGDVESIAVDYINAAPNYLALIPLEGR